MSTCWGLARAQAVSALSLGPGVPGVFDWKRKLKGYSIQLSHYSKSFLLGKEKDRGLILS